MEKKKKHPGWIKKLRSRYRLLIINETDFQEKAALKLTPLSLIMLLSAGFLLFFAISWLLIFAIPQLRIYMPGYEADKEKKFKKEVIKQISDYENTISRLEEKTVLLDILLKGQELSKTDMAILQDQIDPSKEPQNNFRESEFDTFSDENTSAPIVFSDPSESVFVYAGVHSELSKISGLFYPPLLGQVTAFFESNSHPAIDIIPHKDETIKAALDGTVIFGGWTPNFGNVIVIQHPENWITIYKHCAQIYSKKGTKVNAGEGIGVVGNTGDLTSGPHLHFELWHKGIALNPINFIRFK